LALDPEIEESCVTDLGRYCSDHEKELGKGDVSIICMIMPFIFVLFRNSMYVPHYSFHFMLACPWNLLYQEIMKLYSIQWKFMHGNIE
jgi:hypothetical protein